MQVFTCITVRRQSLLETSHVLPQAPWEMHAAIRDARLARNTPA
jgi:hypothetical protein